MAISATMVWEFDVATGNAANGGGYDAATPSAGTNYAWGVGQAVYALTAIANSPGDWTKITCGSRAFVAADVGNVINITGGTSFTTGRYLISAVVGSTATLDRACGSGADQTDGTGNLGGSLDVPTTALIAVAVAGNIIYIKKGTYTIAASITAGTAGTAVLPINIIGYNTSHGDNPTIASVNQPTINMTGGSYAWTIANYVAWRHLTFNTAAASYAYALVTGSYCLVEDCKATSVWITTPATQGNIFNASNSRVINCEISGCWGYGVISASSVQNCYIHDCNYRGLYDCLEVIGCIIESCNTGIYQTSVVQRIHFNTIVNCVIGIEGVASLGANITSNIIAYCNQGIYWSTTTQDNFFANNNSYGNAVADGGIPTGVNAPINASTDDPAFVTTVTAGTVGKWNVGISTFYEAAGNHFAGVTANVDTLVVWSGTGISPSNAGVYLITGVTDDNSVVLNRNIAGGSLLTGDIKWAIVKGGASTNLSLQSSSACIGTGYGIVLGVG